jgi:CelD/BcsL family acetyltransferase involved in cellulose biosynthesis
VSTGALPRAAGSPTPLEARWICDADALLALGPVWNRLVEEAGIDHPFLRHEWIYTWWECFGAGRQLRVLLLSRGSDPIAIAPLMLGRERFYGLYVRCLQLIGNEYTERCDVIIARDPARAYPLLWHALAAERHTWDVLLFRQIPAESPTIATLSTLAANDGFATGVWHAAASPFVRLQGRWEDYCAGLARKHRANLRNRRRRLEALGPVYMEVVRDGEEVATALEDGFRIEALAWKGRAGTAIECKHAVRLFYTRLAVRSARRGFLRLQFLTVGGRRVAFAYALQIHKTLYLLKPGYDPSYAPYSPSSLLCALALRDAFASGLEIYDLLGTDAPWKRDWTGEARAHDWLFVFGRSRRGRALRLAKLRVVPGIRRVSAYFLER